MRYTNLFIMTILSFISMYLLMYAMVDQYANIYTNLNQVYMAGLMTVPMVIIELFLMGSMYGNKKLNALLVLVSGITLLVLFALLRKQVAIGDREFLKSMIPHHGAALLMCKEAPLQDPELKNLCKNIIAAQQSEIDFMKGKLEKLSK